MGGTYQDFNVSYLSLEEHYVAHQLLAKMFPENLSIVRAAFMMGNARKGNKVYGWLRRKFVESITGKNHPLYGKNGINSPNYGKRRSQESKLKMSLSAKRRGGEHLKGILKTSQHRLKLSLSKIGKPGHACSETTKEKLREQKLGKPRSDETRTRISLGKTGKKATDQTKAILSASHMGIPKPENKRVVVCPHCLKEGQQSGMLRWHFSNCKVISCT